MNGKTNFYKKIMKIFLYFSLCLSNFLIMSCQSKKDVYFSRVDKLYNEGILNELQSLKLKNFYIVLKERDWLDSLNSEAFIDPYFEKAIQDAYTENTKYYLSIADDYNIASHKKIQGDSTRIEIYFENKEDQYINELKLMIAIEDFQEKILYTKEYIFKNVEILDQLNFSIPNTDFFPYKNKERINLLNNKYPLKRLINYATVEFKKISINYGKLNENKTTKSNNNKF